jgi:uncharacterized protein YceH (UPF0502 family)
MDPDPVEIRVLGCLIEKQRTTPDAYPLTLNSLRLACNQATNRDPVSDYGDGDIRGALERLGRRRWIRNASWSGSRAMKYKHMLDEALDLSDPQLALLGVLMLRGSQTPGELKARSERLHRFASLDEVQGTLDGLIERALAARLPRRPGQKEERYEQLLGGGQEATQADAARPGASRAEPPAKAAEPPQAGPSEPAGPRPSSAATERPELDRLAELERRLGRVEQELGRLRDELGA